MTTLLRTLAVLAAASAGAEAALAPGASRVSLKRLDPDELSASLLGARLAAALPPATLGVDKQDAVNLLNFLDAQVGGPARRIGCPPGCLLAPSWCPICNEEKWQLSVLF